MTRTLLFATALGLLAGGATQAAGITSDPGTECQWSPQQRVRAADCPPAAAPIAVTPVPEAPPRQLFPEMNVRELCATLGTPARPYCEARNWAARDQLVELWPELSDQDRRECSARTAPPHARYVVIVSCAQAKLDRRLEAQWKASE